MTRPILITLIFLSLMVSAGCTTAQSNDQLIDESILDEELLNAMELAASIPDPELRLRAYDRGFLLLLIALSQKEADEGDRQGETSVQIAELRDDIHRATLSSDGSTQLQAYDRIVEERFGFAIGTGEWKVDHSADSTGPTDLAYFQRVGEIRGVTSDTPRRTFIIEPVIGYDRNNQQLHTEIESQAPRIRREIDFYFSKRSADRLLGSENRRRVKQDLVALINQFLSSGEVADVAFQQYQIVDF
jgi:flagellar basal body-associated protein FliL